MASIVSILVEHKSGSKAKSPKFVEKVGNEELLTLRIEQQKTIAKLSEEALAGIEFEDFFNKVVVETSKVLKVELVKILELVSDKEFKIKAAVGLKKGYKIGYPIKVSNHTHAGYSFLHSKPIVVTNLKHEKRFEGSELLADHKIISGMSVIIRGEKKAYGVLTAHSTKENRFTKDEVDFFASTANLVALFIERKNLERSLTLYQERFSHAQDAGQIGLYDFNIKNGDIWWSDEQYQLMGEDSNSSPISPQELMNKIMFKDDIQVYRKAFSDAVKSKKDLAFDFRINRNDGTIGWLKAKAKIYYDKKGKPVRMLGVNYDITERKATENALFFLSEASKILSSSLDYDKTLKVVARIAVPIIADWCAIDLLDQDGNPELMALSHADKTKISWALKYREANPPRMDIDTGLAKVVKTGKSEFYPSIDPKLFENIKPKEKKVLEKLGGITGVIMVPIKSKDKVIGVMTLLTSESKRIFNELDLKIVEQIADRASLAIENATLYQRVDRERKRLVHLLYNVPGIVWENWVDPNEEEQRINFVSNYIERMIGYTPDKWIGIDFWNKIVHPNDRELVEEKYNEMMTKGKGGIIRFRIITKKGKVIWAETHLFVAKDATGKSIGMRGVTMDVTERVEMEKRKDEFISMASHELKTPLTSMKVFSHLLEKKISNSKELNPYISRMDEQINKLTGLVNDLLDISKIQAGRLEIKREKISLKEFVQEVTEEMKLVTKEHIVLADVEDQVIYADKDRLAQVLVNLISNAIKYSPPKTPIEVKARVDGDRIVFSVKDEGFGISKEHQDKIFERFYRVYDNIDRTYPGLGMGLYISSQIVKRHQGQMWLESKKGKGSTFYFSVPSKLSN